MDLKKFNFPELDKADIAFSTLRTDAALLKEATSRGFYNGNTKYNEFFSTLFYSGGSIVFKKAIV